MQLRTIAIDDEPLALQLVESYIRKTPFLELSGAFDSSLDAVEFLQNNPVDLIFVDIQMPDLTGIELVRTLPDPPKIIFTTAFEKYAIEGFRLNAIDYLLKPFSYEDFLKAAQKAHKLVEMESGAFQSLESNNDYLFLKSEYKIRRIRFDNILYIEGMKDYIKVFTNESDKPILSLNSMKTIESRLPASHFLRVHRSFIVSLGQINTIERNHIVFGKTFIPIGEQYKEKFQDFLNRNFL